MLVLKAKPCMSKYKQFYTVKLRMAHYISNRLFDSNFTLDNRGKPRANTCAISLTRQLEGDVFIR